MRKTCLDEIYRLAKADERIFFVGSDLGVGVLREFATEMPDRFLMEGVSEANVIGMAAGLALEGKIVYVNTIATFITRRCFEQLVLDLGLHCASVRIIGNGGGLVYAPLGPTHLAVDDCAILRTIPNMAIVVPADADEMRRLMPLTVDHEGPLYIRLAKGHDQIVSKAANGFRIGHAILMRAGRDALIIASGITLRLALEAADRLATRSVQVTVLHVHTLKPLDESAIIQHATEVPVIVTVEEHTILGGLGSAVAELIAEANFPTPKRFLRIGIPDVFADEYGSQETLLARYSITTDRVVTDVERLLGLSPVHAV